MVCTSATFPLSFQTLAIDDQSIWNIVTRCLYNDITKSRDINTNSLFKGLIEILKLFFCLHLIITWIETRLLYFISYIYGNVTFDKVWIEIHNLLIIDALTWKSCWLIRERNIPIYLLQVLVICMSERFTRNKKMRQMFFYATEQLHKPFVVAVMDETLEWQQTDIGFKIGIPVSIPCKELYRFLYLYHCSPQIKIRDKYY